jgi:hypothetical protein
MAGMLARGFFPWYLTSLIFMINLLADYILLIRGRVLED